MTTSTSTSPGDGILFPIAQNAGPRCGLDLQALARPLPTLRRGNAQAPSMMIGEKGAALVLGE